MTSEKPKELVLSPSVYLHEVYFPSVWTPEDRLDGSVAGSGTLLIIDTVLNFVGRVWT